MLWDRKGSVGRHYSGVGCSFEKINAPSGVRVTVFVHFESKMCKFCCDGVVVAVHSNVPASEFPCRLGVCGHNGTLFKITPMNFDEHRCSGTCGSPVRYTVQACLHTFKQRNDYMCAHRNHAQYRYSRALLLQRTEHLREKIFCFLVGALLGQNCPIPLASNHTLEAPCVFDVMNNVHKLKSSKNEAQKLQPSKQDLRF